jgi:hypothetical protein
MTIWSCNTWQPSRSPKHWDSWCCLIRHMVSICGSPLYTGLKRNTKFKWTIFLYLLCTLSAQYCTVHSAMSTICYKGVGAIRDMRCSSSSPGRVKNCDFFISCRPALRSTLPPIQWVLRAVSPGVKRQERETDHSPLSSAELKNRGAVSH